MKGAIIYFLQNQIQRLISLTLFFLIVFASSSLIGQEVTVIEESWNPSERAFSLYDEQVYDAAYEAFQRLLDNNSLRTENDKQLLTKVKLYKALSLIKKRSANCEFELLRFIADEQANPYINLAYIELADFYYNDQDYARAIEYFAGVDLDDLSNDRYSEIVFKKAYSHFVRKDFGVSKNLLAKILHLKNKYFYPANYYYGMSQYFTNELEEAVLSFQRLSNSSAYQDRIPYYISQIYFNQKRYDELIPYASEIVQKKSTKNIKEIRGLLGQTFFIQKQYPDAILHLSYYVENTQKLRAEDFYQLGFAYYQSNQFTKAIPQFVEIANEQSKMGQNANNYLADSYLRTSNKDAARNAFKRTSEMTFIPDLAEEALFNFGKLSAEMQLDREALNSLKRIEPSSVYFPESQKILAHILENTNDYPEALQFIEDLEMQSPVMRKSYQKLAYLYAMQFLVDGNTKTAVSYFVKANKNPINNEITALTNYRLADIEHNNSQYNESITYLNQYFSLVKTGISLPKDASKSYANYLQAYNYLKLENYTTARKFFQEAAAGFYGNQAQKKLMMDALLRAGDCYFRINAYQDAIAFYNDAINLKAKGTDYALYQRGILQGLLGKPFEKIISLEEIFTKYPQSPLADFALYQNGETLLAIGKSTEAEKSFRKIIDQYKKSTLLNRANLKLGLIAFNQGNLSTAISYYKNLFNHNPNAKESQEAMIALEEIYVENLGDPDSFFTFIENQGGFKMSDFEKDSISFRSGDIPYENGEYDRAITAYTNYLSRYPEGFNRIVAHYRRAESYVINKDFKKALKDYNYVVRQGANQYYLQSLDKAALISYNLVEDYKTAFNYYSLLEELELDPSKQYNYQMGALRSAARINDKKAMEYMASKVMKNKLLITEDRALALFYLGKINSENKVYAKALEQLNEVLELSDNIFTAEARYLIANIHYTQKKYDLAEKVAREAIVKSKPYPYWVAKSLIVLSDVFIEKEDLLQAKAAVEAIIENFNQDDTVTEEAKAKLRNIILLENAKNRIEQDSLKGDLKMDDGSNNRG